jgi:hypothetical protein
MFNPKSISLLILFSIISLPYIGCNKSEPIISDDFEINSGSWDQSKSIQFSLSDEKNHTGKMSMKVHGVSPSGAWSFVQTKHIPLEKGKHYRMTGWLLVDYAGAEMPFFKCALFIHGGTWFKNKMSTQYNKEQIKDWQELIAEFETPKDKDIEFVLSLEKRPFSSVVGATVFIDDITLVTLD